jgi:hypothetical protein
MKVHFCYQGSTSPTFFERNCAIFFEPIKSLTFTSRTKKLRAKLSYKITARKMLVKLTPDAKKKGDTKKKL